MNHNQTTPLAERMRPVKLDEFVGQDHLLGEDKILRRLIDQKQIPSLILWGPPGSGKTTLANIIAREVGAEFVKLSATLSGVKDIRAAMAEAESSGKQTILFIDEIHRFNKSQQDSLLPHVEKGTVILIGATTENPSFEVNSALLSRTRVFTLNPIDRTAMETIIKRALTDYDRGLGKNEKFISDEVLNMMIEFSNADARTALNILDLSTKMHAGEDPISVETLKEAAQKTYMQYDRDGEEHYNTISAYIKSMRSGDVNAALYYLARMIVSGEDPKFIARRMVIFASEDIGMAMPTALVVANEVFKACETIGYPECQINLAHGTVYMASQPKNRQAYNAYFSALNDVNQYGNLPIPMEIRNAPTKLMKDLGYGKNYKQYGSGSLLPEKLRNKKYY